MNIIVAVDENWGIGCDGTQPVVIPEDRKFFSEKTAGGTVIVGRKTLADFPGGRPLKNRRNIVMSTDSKLTIEGAEIAHDLRELAALLEGEDTDKVFVIGGDSVYRLLSPYCRFAWVTKIEAAPPADRFFTNLDKSADWVLEAKGRPQISGGVRFSFDRYGNRNVRELDTHN